MKITKKTKIYILSILLIVLASFSFLMLTRFGKGIIGLEQPEWAKLTINVFPMGAMVDVEGSDETVLPTVEFPDGPDKPGVTTYKRGLPGPLTVSIKNYQTHKIKVWLDGFETKEIVLDLRGDKTIEIMLNPLGAEAPASKNALCFGRTVVFPASSGAYYYTWDGLMFYSFKDKTSKWVANLDEVIGAFAYLSDKEDPSLLIHKRAQYPDPEPVYRFHLVSKKMVKLLDDALNPTLSPLKNFVVFFIGVPGKSNKIGVLNLKTNFIEEYDFAPLCEKDEGLGARFPWWSFDERYISIKGSKGDDAFTSIPYNYIIDLKTKKHSFLAEGIASESESTPHFLVINQQYEYKSVESKLLNKWYFHNGVLSKEKPKDVPLPDPFKGFPKELVKPCTEVVEFTPDRKVVTGRYIRPDGERFYYLFNFSNSAP